MIVAADPGADAGQQFHVAGAHAADGVGRQQQRQADRRAHQAPAESFPAERDRADDPAAEDHRKRDPVGNLQLVAVDHGGHDQRDRHQPEAASCWFRFAPNRAASIIARVP